MTREEAIRRIKARFDKWALDDEDMKAIQALAPELRESEDERIRKWLLECVENLPDVNFIEVSKQDVLFYLEKQKEGPSLPSNLDEAAEEYADCNSQRWHEDGDVYYDHSKIMDAFKAGAEWSKKDEGQEPEYYQHFDPDC